MARGRLLKVLHSVENSFSPLLLLLATLILAADIVARLLGVSALRASTDYVRHLVLWISFAGAMITTCELLAGPRVRVARTPGIIRSWGYSRG